jgi:hypothetical protein
MTILVIKIITSVCVSPGHSSYAWGAPVHPHDKKAVSPTLTLSSFAWLHKSRLPTAIPVHGERQCACTHFHRAAWQASRLHLQ